MTRNDDVGAVLCGRPVANIDMKMDRHRDLSLPKNHANPYSGKEFRVFSSQGKAIYVVTPLQR